MQIEFSKTLHQPLSTAKRHGTEPVGSARGHGDSFCGLVVRVLDYKSRGPGFDSRALQKKSSGSGTGSTQPCEYN
jgi:hypothetical protein